jgi:16S rRNA (adenine1518-N6/adenine1519-N6)-dimethyltransferase
VRPRARKRFGQHFLERAWVAKLVRAIAAAETDKILEIGPGAGALTLPLAAAVHWIVAVEIDHDLTAALRSTAPPNVSVIEGDFLDLTADRLLEVLSDTPQRSVRAVSDTPRRSVRGVSEGCLRQWRVVGNLPYNVASPILFKLVELHRLGVALVDATLMLQREVADRLLAEPGSRVYGIPSVLIRHAADVERVFDLPPGAFRPRPKVESTVVRLRFRDDRPAVRSREALAKLVHAVFTRRRKTLANALLAYRPDAKADIEAALTQAGIDGRRRPESLDIADYVRLSDAFEPAGRDRQVGSEK